MLSSPYANQRPPNTNTDATAAPKRKRSAGDAAAWSLAPFGRAIAGLPKDTRQLAGPSTGRCSQEREKLARFNRWWRSKSCFRPKPNHKTNDVRFLPTEMIVSPEKIWRRRVAMMAHPNPTRGENGSLRAPTAFLETWRRRCGSRERWTLANHRSLLQTY